MLELVLQCRELSVVYGPRVVFEGLSLDFWAGQWCAVVGPNGCGKSTLLRALAGLVRPRAGSVLLQGRGLATWSRRGRARKVAWLAQGTDSTELTGAEVVSLGRFAHTGWLGERRDADAAAIQRAMRDTGSLVWHARKMSTLSGGERQRVYLARALAVQASVLLLDEPTTHLDPPHQQDVVRLLRAQAQRPACVVSAIHDLSLALAADRLIVMGHNGLVGAGSIAEALAGDWLSTAFATPIRIVEHAGARLWLPAL